MKKNSGSNGFLLFEVIVSIAVVTSGLLFVMRPFVTAKASVERSRELLVTSLLAENKLQELKAAGVISEGQWRGDFAGNEPYGWSADSAGHDAEDINEVTVKVFRKDSPGRIQSSITTYILGKSYVESSA